MRSLARYFFILVALPLSSCTYFSPFVLNGVLNSANAKAIPTMTDVIPVIGKATGKFGNFTGGYGTDGAYSYELGTGEFGPLERVSVSIYVESSTTHISFVDFNNSEESGFDKDIIDSINLQLKSTFGAEITFSRVKDLDW